MQIVPTDHPSSDTIKQWIKKALESFADDAFEDLYSNNLPKAYAFPGDDEWFRYSQNRVHSRGACIAEFRPHLHKRFFSEEQINRHSILSSASRSYVARLFILRAIDEYVKINIPRARWLNAVVVMNEDIEMSAYKLQTNLVPVILQVFSSFWVYDQGRVYVCDDVYETVGVWFWLVHTRYKNRVYDIDFTQFIQQVGLWKNQHEQLTENINNLSVGVGVAVDKEKTLNFEL